MSSFSITKQVIGLLGWLLISFAASAIGAIASVQAKSFYGQLIQPGWAPPPGVFGPVWTTLFFLMGVAAWLVWRADGHPVKRQALVVFLIQLAVNALWSWLFFGWRLGLWALVDIAVLWLLIVATTALFWRVRPLAGLLLVPYLCWVAFAFVLNLSLLQLNPQVLG